MDGAVQVGLVGGTGYVVVGVVAEERGEAEGVVEGGGEEGEEEEEGSGWFGEGEHFLLFLFAELSSAKCPAALIVVIFSNPFSSLSLQKETKSRVKLPSHIP